LRNAFSGGISTFNCVVYFVRKADSQEIRWGTDTPIQVRDKVWGIRTSAKVRGAYKVRIENPVKFLEKLIGNNVPYQLQQELGKYFDSEFQGKIKSAVSKFLNSLPQELIGIDAYMGELSTQIGPYIDEVVEEYGLKCVRFSLAGLDIDISKYDAIDESQIAAITKGNLARGDKATIDILGEDWGRQQAANILGDLARNPGAGGVSTMGAGMGMGVAAGSVFGNMANQMFAPMGQQPAQPVQQSVQQPSQPVFSGRFARKGTDQPVQQAAPQTHQAGAEDPFETLSKLKRMLDAGLISQQQYDAKVDEVMSRM
jgi:membrane protease subunit (stomatin/prohibitin family)